MQLQIPVKKRNHQIHQTLHSHRWGLGTNHVNMSQESNTEREELRDSFLAMDVSDWMIMRKFRFLQVQNCLSLDWHILYYQMNLFIYFFAEPRTN